MPKRAAGDRNICFRIPNSLREWLYAQVEAGFYSSVSSAIRQILEKYKKDVKK